MVFKLICIVVVLYCIYKVVHYVKQLMSDIDPENNKGQIY